MKNGAIENEGVEFAVFAARVGAGRKIAEERGVKFTAGEAGVENLRIDASDDGAEMLFVEIADQLACIVFPEGKDCGHADTGEIFFAVSAEVFEEDVAESDLSNTFVTVGAEGLFHAGLIDGIDALRRNRDFVKRQAERGRLAMEKFAADTVHGDAVVALGDGSKKGGDVELLLLEQREQRHGAVFAAAPAEKNGFRCRQENLQVVWHLLGRGAPVLRPFEERA